MQITNVAVKNLLLRSIPAVLSYKVVTRYKKLLSKQGFTLMELLVVLIIVLILSTVAWHSYGKVQEKARATEILGLLKSVAVAQRLYYQTHDQWASSFDGLDIDIPFTGTTAGYSPTGLTDTRSNSYWSLQLAGSRVWASRLGGDYQGGGFNLDLDTTQPKLFCVQRSFSKAENKKYCNTFFKTGTTRHSGVGDLQRYVMP